VNLNLLTFLQKHKHHPRLILTSSKFSALSLITYFLHHQFLRRSDSRGVTDFQYRYSFISLLSYLFCTTIHTTQVNSIRPTVTVKRESKLSQIFATIVFMSSFMKTIIFSPNASPGTLSSYTFPDVCTLQKSIASFVFLSVPHSECISFIRPSNEPLTICQLQIYLARPQNILAMYNFSLSVTDHDNF
jgi:hypothetical protein